METFGSLVDKLSIVNLKIYHAEDIAHEPGTSLEDIGRAKKKINVLNNQRNALIQEFDELFMDVMNGEKPVPKVYEQFKDYGKK